METDQRAILFTLRWLVVLISLVFRVRFDEVVLLGRPFFRFQFEALRCRLFERYGCICSENDVVLLERRNGGVLLPCGAMVYEDFEWFAIRMRFDLGFPLTQKCRGADYGLISIEWRQRDWTQDIRINVVFGLSSLGRFCIIVAILIREYQA